jgi:hypothetical protein
VGGLGRESGRVEGGQVAFGARDAQPEQVAQVAGGQQLVEDAVLAQRSITGSARC